MPHHLLMSCLPVSLKLLIQWQSPWKTCWWLRLGRVSSHLLLARTMHISVGFGIYSLMALQKWLGHYCSCRLEQDFSNSGLPLVAAFTREILAPMYLGIQSGDTKQTFTHNKLQRSSFEILRPTSKFTVKHTCNPHTGEIPNRPVTSDTSQCSNDWRRRNKKKMKPVGKIVLKL